MRLGCCRVGGLGMTRMVSRRGDLHRARVGCSASTPPSRCFCGGIGHPSVRFRVSFRVSFSAGFNAGCLACSEGCSVGRGNWRAGG